MQYSGEEYLKKSMLRIFRDFVARLRGIDTHSRDATVKMFAFKKSAYSI